MNTRFRCVAPAPNIANWRASFASWRVPASFPDRGEAYCSLRYPSIAELPISTVKPRDKAGHDRRNAGMDDVAAGRAFGVGDVTAGAQALRYGKLCPERASRRELSGLEHSLDPGADRLSRGPRTLAAAEGVRAATHVSPKATRWC